jgi:5-methylcytosine-specific restriction endonuclease McrA
MSHIASNVLDLHDRWANGQTAETLNHLQKKFSSAREESEQVTFASLLGRFYAQSGHSERAAEVFAWLDRRDGNLIDASAEFWWSISRAYYEYEINLDFQACRVLLNRAIRAGRNLPSDDVQVLVASAHWRLSGIELADGQLSDFRKHQDAALSMARDLEHPHEIGIVHLSRGYAYLAQNMPHLAYDEFLRGLFCVGYLRMPAPNYLHAELMLGVVAVQMEVGAVKPLMAQAVDEFTALDRIRKVMSCGTNRFVTPYPGYRKIDPYIVSRDLLRRSSFLRRKIAAIRKRSIADLRGASVQVCAWCRRESDIEIDHIMPKAWGGTDWEGNLRILCRRCNSQRKHSFVYTDKDGYARLVGAIGELGEHPRPLTCSVR